VNKQRRTWWRAPESFSFKTDLDSATSDEKFIAEFNVTWKAVRGPKINSCPHAVIRHHLRVAANKISSERPVTQCAAAADEISAALATPHDNLRQSGIRISQTRVKVTVDRETLARAASRERSRKNARQRKQQLDDEIQYVDAFRSQVLADPGMALSFWLMKHPDKIDGNAYSHIENLSRRIAAYDPGNIWVHVALVVQDFAGKLTEEEQRRSIKFLREWFTRYGMPEYADRLPRIPDSSSPKNTNFPAQEPDSPFPPLRTDN
jgi:hypothetical protein